MDMCLVNTLNDFASKANGNDQVRRVTKNWTVDIEVECTDNDERFVLEVAEGRINKVVTNPVDKRGEGKESILLRSHTGCFMDIFEGRCNPAIASLEGDLQVFGDESHSVKLDAIALILWGFH